MEIPDLFAYYKKHPPSPRGYPVVFWESEPGCSCARRVGRQ